MKTKFTVLILGLFLLTVMPFALAGNGAIWTTTSLCGEEKQDVNHYAIGDVVYINGANFNAGTYDWKINGLGNSDNSGASCDPNQVVKNGSYMVDSSGAFCFKAYVVQNDDCGEYHVDFNNKKDNFRVSSAVVPEFGVVLGVMTLLSSAGVFFLVRRN